MTLPARFNFAEHLFALKRLRLIGREAGVSRLRVGKDRFEVELERSLKRDQILRLVASTPARIEFVGGGTGSFRVRSPAEPISPRGGQEKSEETRS